MSNKSYRSRASSSSSVINRRRNEYAVVCPPSGQKKSSGGFCPRPDDKCGGSCPGEFPLRCDKGPRTCYPPCGSLIKATQIQWCNRETVCDDIGAGIRPKIDSSKHRKDCCTPMSQYMAVHGELARKFLTRELCVPRTINGPPPCSACEYCVKPCRGYYRKHECIKPEEYDQMIYKDGKKVLRDRVERYWNPCPPKDAEYEKKLADLAGHNVGLLKRLVVKRGGPQCW